MGDLTKYVLRVEILASHVNLAIVVCNIYTKIGGLSCFLVSNPMVGIASFTRNSGYFFKKLGNWNFTSSVSPNLLRIRNYIKKQLPYL